ncbi:BRO family protein [Sphaerisporangium sp. TRM90804]|uniref:BRO family protein n=1 Tax=Sphaerisporangium sp. TRM90804 TaxID=3031113 RepID=UPI00244B513D|nr:BRO family protein [Sphaerisporangium sp. TRM90804]MDH2424836.1 hypothetical protein [Sphaerisporangium sp. TRM90804]
MSNLEHLGGASPFDAIKRVDERGEFWSARDLQPLEGYTNWRQFMEVVEKAKAAAQAVGAAVHDHFEDALKITRNARGHKRPVDDHRLTRYACYLVAMNGDPRKPEVAAAQTYFAVRTHEAEVRSALDAAAKLTVETPPSPELFEPLTFPWADAVVLMRQRFGVRIAVVELTRVLRQGGVLRQDGKPRVEYQSLFWLTAKSTYEVFGHAIEPLYRLYESTKIRLDMAAQRALPLDPPGWPELPLGGES